MARFDTINEMTMMVTYAGWRFDRPPGQKITSDCSSTQAAGDAIKAYARDKGLDAQNVPFYIVEETTTFKPISKTVFTIQTKTDILP